MKLRSIDIPQADTLATVRQVVDALSHYDNPPAKVLAEALEIHERHVRYRLAAARALGLLTAKEEGTALTARATRLLGTEPGSTEEKKELRRAVSACPAVQEIDPELLKRPSVDVKALAHRIMRLSGLSQATAERRAIVLRAWHRDLQ
jgi:DNA-binding Lrp family transcriptional regulator